jgi:hypothetical protein
MVEPSRQWVPAHRPLERGVHCFLDEARGERLGGGVEALDGGFERIGGP